MNLIFKDQEFYKGLISRATAKGLMRKLTEDEILQRLSDLDSDCSNDSESSSAAAPEWISVEAAGRILRRTPSAVHKYRRYGFIKKFKEVDRNILYHVSEIKLLAKELKKNPRLFDRRGKKSNG